MKTGTTPEALANALLAAPGNLVIYNQGYYPFVAKFMLLLADRAFLTEIMARIAHTLPSYKAIKGGAKKISKKTVNNGKMRKTKKKRGKSYRRKNVE